MLTDSSVEAAHSFACFTLLSRQMWGISNVCWKSVEFNVAGSWSICVCPTQKAFSTDQNQKNLTVLNRDSIHSVTWVQTSLSSVWISSLWGKY